MLSRVSDNLYWMSRYLERAEHTSRVIGIQLNLMLDESGDSAGRRWSRLLEALNLPADPDADIYSYAQGRAFDLISTCIMSARENARQVREQISTEMWEQLNRLFHEVKRMGTSDIWEAQPLDFIIAVQDSCHLFQGLTDSTMNHGEGWRFIQVGRFMERAIAVAKLLDIHFREFLLAADQGMDSTTHLEWIGLLRSCTAFESYCKVYTADLKPERIAEFLLLNAEFPHSVRFAVDQMQQSLEAIHETTSSKKAERVAKLAGRLRAELSFTPLEEIMSNPHEFLDTIGRQCAQIHSAIYQIYIRYDVAQAFLPALLLTAVSFI
jgi:uncharacterized alpha-E superfamily protein